MLCETNSYKANICGNMKYIPYNCKVNVSKVLITESKIFEHVNKCCGYQMKEDLLPSLSIPKVRPLISPSEEPTVSQISCILASLVLESEQLLALPDEGDIDHNKTDTFKQWFTISSDTDILSLIHLSGDEDLQSRLRALCTYFTDILVIGFLRLLSPSNLIVDDIKWRVGVSHHQYHCHHLAIQDYLLKAAAKESLRNELLHLTSKEQNIYKEYLPNSYVLVHYRAGLTPTRLHTSWKGPMRVIKGLNSRYTFLVLTTGKEKNFRVSGIKPFVFDSALVDLLDIARRDQMEFLMEKIFDHRGSKIIPIFRQLAGI